jgi:putative flippase GtrA
VRALRFAAVGVVGTALDLGLFALLHLSLGMAALPANTISYSAGIVNNYLLHRRWTYADRPRRPTGAQFCQFALVSLSALALNNLIVLWLSPGLGALLGRADLGAVAAKLLATSVGMVWNFAANTAWTFRRDSAAVGDDR